MSTTDSPRTIDIASVTDRLQYSESGLWQSDNQTSVSHPTECQDWYLAVEDNSYWFRHRAACIVACLNAFPPEGNVFDVGGGNGHVSLAMQHAGYSPILVEPSMKAAKNAQQRGIDPIICATLEDAGFCPGSVPAVGTFDVLEHIEDDVAFLNTIRDVLVPQGRVYLTVPAFRWLWSDYDVYVGHYRRYTVGRLRRLLESCGFQIDFASYLYSPLPLPIFLMRSLPSRLRLSKRNFERFQKEHATKPGLASRALQGLLNQELARIARQQPIPFGSSCLMVAHKQA